MQEVRMDYATQTRVCLGGVAGNAISSCVSYLDAKFRRRADSPASNLILSHRCPMLRHKCRRPLFCASSAREPVSEELTKTV